MATFNEIPAKYDAVQWTAGGDVEAFAAIVDPTNTMPWSAQPDGSLGFVTTVDGSLQIVPLNGWIVSLPYWSHVAWSGMSWTGIFSDVDFQAQWTPLV